MATAALILVVEDNAPVRDGLAAVLLRAGFQVQPACDGRQALHLITTGPRPDLILLDMVMPGLDGWDFLERLPRLPPQTHRPGRPPQGGEAGRGADAGRRGRGRESDVG
jgi:CheY-like chemotaxis protein